MVIASKLTSIGIIGLSITVGFISFYVISDLSKEQRKAHIEGMVSQLINLIIFIWLGKIIINFSIFIKDPLPILAYPSSSNAFYIAVIVTIVVNVLKSKKRQINNPIYVESALSVFLVASFVYEFIQFVWNNHSYSFGYLVVLCILLVLFFANRGRIAARTLITLMLTGWSTGLIILAFIQPFVTVFGYIMDPWFVCLFFFINFSFIIIKNRKKG